MSEQLQQPNQERRDFLAKTLVAATAATVAPGVLIGVADATGAASGASSNKRWGLLIDTNKCADGCSACVDACNKENGIDLMEKPQGQPGPPCGSSSVRNGSAR
jgi:tetrathionate reductase subunit B